VLVLGRQIDDNILITFKIINTFRNTKSQIARVTLKLDIKKGSQ